MSAISLYLGDGIKYMEGLPPKSINAIITDPPYGIGLDYSILFEDTPEYAKKLITSLIEEGVRIADVILFPSGKFETELWLMQNHPPRWRMCWYKGAQSTASPIGFSDWEMIMVYGDNIHRYVHDYMPVRTTPAHSGHPCPKDIHWATWLISKFTNKGDIVLDPFMGIGTTAVACHQLERDFIGCEIEPKYYDIASNRVKKAKSQLIMNLGDLI